MASPVKIFHEFSMDSAMAWPWKTHGIFLQGLPWKLCRGKNSCKPHAFPPIDWPWKNHGIFHEFSMDSPMAWSWKTHGLFHGQSMDSPMDWPWKTRGIFHEFSMANLFGEIHGIPKGLAIENSWSIPRVFHGFPNGFVVEYSMSFPWISQ